MDEARQLRRRIGELQRNAEASKLRQKSEADKRDADKREKIAKQEEAERKGRSVTWFQDCDVCPQMVMIPAGAYTMGYGRGGTNPSSYQPEHRVAIPRSFAVGRFEVTRAQFDAYVRSKGIDTPTGCQSYKYSFDGWSNDVAGNWRAPGFRQTDDDPVVCVTWSQAKDYVVWLSQRTGRRYRLLTEAEWEYSARAGNQEYLRYWHFGQEAPDCRYENYPDEALRRANRFDTAKSSFSSCDDGYANTAPVGRFAPNAFGLYDMLGNAREWTADCWHQDYVGAPADGSAWAQGTCEEHVVRGGSWMEGRDVTDRAGWGDVRTTNTGFRVARD